MPGGGDSGAQEAAEVQAQAARESAALSREQFAQTRDDLEPVREQLAPAVSMESALLGLAGTAEQEQALADFKERPDQRFLREEAERAILRNQSAIGGLGGGNVRQELQRQAIGVSSQRIGEQLDRLAGIRTGGQQSALSLGGLGAQSALSQGQSLQGAAAATASGILAQPTNQFGGALGTIGKAAGSAVGTAFGGPLGGVVGGALGGLAGLLG